MGISRDKWHKRRKTGGRRPQPRKKRKFELGRPPSNTKLGGHRVHIVRVRGGSVKHRALRLEQGNFAWGSEGIARKTRILDVVYNASSNELVRTKTLVKNTIVQIDSAPFRQWYESHYCLPLKRKGKPTQAEDENLSRTRSKSNQKKFIERQKTGLSPPPPDPIKDYNYNLPAAVEPHLDDQFAQGRLYACVSSRPGQCGRCDGYILEGKELDFYLRKFRHKKHGK